MSKSVQRLSNVFVAGAVGGLANGLAVWLFGRLGVAMALGVMLAPPLTPMFLYPRLAWGGLWGLLFLLAWKKGHPWLRGLVFSLGPSLVMLFVVFPYQLHKGVMGLELGTLMPLFVLFYNAIWGLVAVWWLKLLGQE